MENSSNSFFEISVWGHELDRFAGNLIHVNFMRTYSVFKISDYELDNWIGKCIHNWMSFPVKRSSLCPVNLPKRVKVGEIQWFFGFNGPRTPAGQGPCGFDKGPSLVAKWNIKSLASTYVTELDRKNCFLPRTLNRSSSVTHGLA